MLSADDLALAQQDAALPGLATLLYTDAMRNWLRRAAAHSPEFVFDRAEGIYARYKRGQSFMLLACASMPHSTALITLSCYRPDATEKIEKTRTFAREHPSARVWIDDQAAIVACIFPTDRALPSLARLHEQEARARVLSKMLGDASRDAQLLATLRYKPHRRWASLWQVADTRMVLKAYAEDDFEPALANTTCAAPFAPQLIAHSARHRLIASAWVEGETCTVDDTAACAAAIARLHASRASFPQLVDESVLATWARASAAAASEVLPDQSSLAHELATSIINAVRTARTVVPLHGDWSPDQCIRGASGVRLIDFDNAVMGPPELDLGNFAAKCAIATGNLSAIDPLLNAYAHDEQHDPRPHVAPFVALGLLRAATDAFRRRAPGWGTSCRETLALAREVLRAR